MDQADRSVQGDTQNVASTRCSSSRQAKCWPLKNLSDTALLVKRCSSFESPQLFHPIGNRCSGPDFEACNRYRRFCCCQFLIQSFEAKIEESQVFLRIQAPQAPNIADPSFCARKTSRILRPRAFYSTW